MIEVDCRKCVNCTGEGCIPLEQALKAEYNKAIDDFVKFANTMPTVEADGEIRPMWLEEIAEQLKEGASDGNG